MTFKDLSQPKSFWSPMNVKYIDTHDKSCFCRFVCDKHFVLTNKDRQIHRYSYLKHAFLILPVITFYLVVSNLIKHNIKDKGSTYQ